MYQTRESLATYRAEILHFIGAHSAIGTSAPHAFLKISASFDKCCFTRIDEIRPLDTEVALGGYVRLPRLGVGKIHRVAVRVFIFVGKAAEAVAELVHHHRLEIFTVSIRQIIGVVDASATVFRGVDQHNDVFVRHACKCVVKTFQT